ncbi:hypothetical protein JW948_05290 [bacterium]|nr:hypothetical protein [bacterium]
MTQNHIRICFGDTCIRARLLPNRSADAVWQSLPLEAVVNTWGQELYFSLPLDIPMDNDAREILEPGDLAYWPVGQTFCLFFGPTPVSTDHRPRAASAVNIFGKVDDDLEKLRYILSGDRVSVDRLMN